MFSCRISCWLLCCSCALAFCKHFSATVASQSENRVQVTQLIFPGQGASLACVTNIHLSAVPCSAKGLWRITQLISCHALLQAADSSAPSTVVVKIVKVSPATAPNRNPESQHTVSILDSTREARISFSAVYQPCNLLERPKVLL